MAKRRANGEGSIRKRQDGRWEGRYTAGYDPKTGKPIYKSVLAKTQGKVKEKLRTAIEHARQVDVVKSGKYTFGQWMDLWYESFCVIHVRPSSHQAYRGYIKNHIKPHLGRVKLEALTMLQLQRFYSKLLASGRVDRIEAANQPKGLSPKTVRNLHNVIHEALNKAVMEKLIPTNPADGCMLPRVEHKEMKTLDLTQLDQFFQEARNSGVFEQYYTELATGLRRGELLGLKWTDINYEARTISIRRQIQRLEGVVQEAPLKTKNAYRSIAVSQELLDILRAKQEEENGRSQYVFSSPTGGPISPDSVLHMLHRVLHRAGLEQLRYHDLRHSFATLALQNGVDVKTLSSMLGHYSAGFTLDTYAHVTTSMQHEAAAKVGGFLHQNI